MESRKVLAAALTVLTQQAVAGCVTDVHSSAPLLGGVVAEVRDADYEFVARPNALRLHIRGHDRSIDLFGVFAKVTLVNGTSRQVAMLQPASDRLEATGRFQVSPGTKAVVVVDWPASPATALRFTLK